VKSRPPINGVITDIEPTQVSFDADAFDLAIRSQGVRLVHFRGQRCPVGMTSMDDIRRPHPHHEGCANGFIYTKAGTITGLFTGNSKTKQWEDVGFIDQSTVQVTFPRNYDDRDEPLVVAPFDRFYLDEAAITVVMWQLIETSPTGKDRLKYPAVALQGDVIDYRGERYLDGIDVRACDGQLEWLGSRRPAPQIDLGPGIGGGLGPDSGAVCSVRYTYRPFFYVGQMPHEVRVAQIQNELSGERKLTRMPQMVVMHREYVSQDKEQDEEAIKTSVDAEALRKVLGASNSGFGPR
jgi:hypothetical protein